MEGKMYINIRHIIGIPALHKEQLQDAGIFSLEDLIRGTNPQNLSETSKETGIWRAALLGYGAIAKAIQSTERDFYKRVSGGHLIFVEDECEEEPPDEDDGFDRNASFHYGFRVVGMPGRERHFVRTQRPAKPTAGQGICVPPTQWIK